MLICSDMDGIWSDYCFGLSAMAHKYGYMDHVLSSRDVDDWNWLDVCMTKNQLGKLMSLVNLSNDFWADLPPISANLGKNMLETLISDGNRLKILTARPGRQLSVKLQTIAWFKHFIGVDLNTTDIIICEADNKLDYVREYKADYFIDDRPKTIIAMNSFTGSTKMFAVKHPYNAYLEPKCPNVQFVNNVSEFLMNVVNQ